VTSWDAEGLVVGERRVPFLAGAMHYWRIERRHWTKCLCAIADLGLTLVETYVPWSVHETSGGRYDWSGGRDLGAFLDAAAAVGLGAVVRPGPHCNAELTGFGFPDRILRDEAMLARSATGGPVWMPAPPRAFPVPSYASAAFRAEVARWYAEVATIVAPRLAPDGPVVAIGVDNEAQMFFRLGAYDHDYHPDALEWFGAEPPRRWDPADAERCVAWVRAKDRYVARALGELTASLEQAGLGGVARFHNLPPGEPFHFDLPGVARAIGGPAGIDVYAGGRDLGAVRRRGLHLTGSSETLPIVPELGVGFFPWLPPIVRSPDEQRDVALTLLGTGMRGASFYMTVGRDRWYGAAIEPDGTPGPAAAWLKPLLDALETLAWPTLRRTADVAVVVSRADARFGVASSLLDPITPVVAEALGHGPGGSAELGRDADAVAYRRWLAVVQQALDLARVPYVLVDESCSAARLGEFRAVIAPTLDRIDLHLAASLRVVADRKHVVVIGPGTPTRDELGRPLPDGTLPRRIGMLRDGSLDDVEGLATDLAALAPPPSPWHALGGDADAAMFADPAGQPRAVVLVNRTAAATRAALHAPEGATLRDAFTGEAVKPGAAAVGPHAARRLIVD
jgi:beta-galactosidase